MEPKIREQEGDLFGAPKSVSLAHCVSSDLKMGAGIAVFFRKIFGCVDELKAQKKTVGEVAYLKDSQRYIFYLITKKWFYNKPTEQTLQSSLIQMKDLCLKFGVKRLAMPRIGCGLDGLKWPSVFRMVKEVFNNSGMEITIYSIPDKRIISSKRPLSHTEKKFRDYFITEKPLSMPANAMVSKHSWVSCNVDDFSETPRKRRKISEDTKKKLDFTDREGTETLVRFIPQTKAEIMTSGINRESDPGALHRRSLLTRTIQNKMYQSPLCTSSEEFDTNVASEVEPMERILSSVRCVEEQSDQRPLKLSSCGQFHAKDPGVESDNFYDLKIERLSRKGTDLPSEDELSQTEDNTSKESKKNILHSSHESLQRKSRDLSLEYIRNSSEVYSWESPSCSHRTERTLSESRNPSPESQAKHNISSSQKFHVKEGTSDSDDMANINTSELENVSLTNTRLSSEEKEISTKRASSRKSKKKSSHSRHKSRKRKSRDSSEESERKSHSSSKRSKKRKSRDSSEESERKSHPSSKRSKKRKSRDSSEESDERKRHSSNRKTKKKLKKSSKSTPKKKEASRKKRRRSRSLSKSAERKCRDSSPNE